MKALRALGLTAALVVAAAARLESQGTAAEMLQHAVSLYENVDFENAMAIRWTIRATSAQITVQAA